jgi:hypothetical protein
MAKLTIVSATLANPKWPGNSLKPGQTATLKVDAPHIKPNQFIEFRIHQNDDLIEMVKGAAGATSVQWKVPNLPHGPHLTFDAVLKDTASPKTGFHAVLAKAKSGPATLQGFRVQVTGGDASFVPHAEKIQITYSVTDPGGVATKGRYEIWGERYPDDAPLYTENFTPAAGAKTWSTWDGKANRGKSAGKYISPEFSPYRVRIIIGVDQASVDDAFGAGISQVAAAEGTFDVAFQSVRIRLQAGIAEAAAGPANAKYTLPQVLGIEPVAANGTYTATGRLPTSTPAETCRIRIPMACHQRSTDALSQGTQAVRAATSNYFPVGGQPKHNIDTAFYTRPEIPIEFELRLRSREAAKNAAPEFGVFDKEAAGPAKLEPFAEDVFLPAIYTGGSVDQVYWRKAALKIKDGQHFAPTNSGAAGIPAAGVPPNAPTFSYWQARFVVAADGDQNFDLDAGDNATDKTYHYEPGKNELTLYLNRTKLVLGANQAALDKVQADYIEVDTHTIKLRARLTTANDVLWVTRSANGAAALPDWNVYPPGTNCHRWYGGLRGADPTNGLFKQNYSTPAGANEPVIGKATGAYPYAASTFINLRPDAKVPANRQERVEVSALTAAGNQQGLAGVLFSPSFIAGDSYAINAFVDAAPYDRNLGWVEAKPAVQAKTGTLTVWRLITIIDSQRLPNPGTSGLLPGIGSPLEAAIGSVGRPYIGDGVNMQISSMNTVLKVAFNEWTIAPPDARAPAAEVHKDINLATYRAQYTAVAFPGQIPMPNNAAIRMDFIPIDAYRLQLPAGFPANRVNAASNVIAGLGAGTTSAAAMAAVQARMTAIGAGPDDALGVGVAAIPQSPAAWTSVDYFWWVTGQLGPPKTRILNALITQIAQPKGVKVVRWPFLHENGLWDDGANMISSTMTLQGEYLGNSQSDFITGIPFPTLFQHEMGHSAHLVHFVGGNCGWKHHNILQPSCMMSYSWPVAFVVMLPPRVGPTVPGTAPDLGWPNQVPTTAAANALRGAGHPYNIDPAFDPRPAANSGGAAGAAAAVGTPCIRLDAIAPHPAPGNPCAKCVLKLRGWQELVLPVAWNHPDLF